MSACRTVDYRAGDRLSLGQCRRECCLNVGEMRNTGKTEGKAAFCTRGDGPFQFKLCVSAPDNLDDLSSTQLRELVVKLFVKLAEQDRAISDLRLEIARLKGLKGPPDIKPSGMDKGTEPAKRDQQQRQRRPGRGKVRPRVSVEDPHSECRGSGWLAV